MCFSAEASFTAGVVLSSIGTATVRKAKPSQKLFGVIPLLFGLQQFAEGVLWITLKSGGHDRLQNSAAYTFLVTALVIWPVMIPLSTWLMEKVKKRRKILLGLIGAGILLALFYSFCLIFYDVTPQIQSFHIKYVDDFPGTPVKIAFVFYMVSTVAPFFISSVKRIWVFGILIASSCVVTSIFFSQYLTSVWCFFAALISISIYWILSELQTKTSPIQMKSQHS